MHSAPKNVILMVGDGMGPAHLKAYRQFKTVKTGSSSQKSLFDPYHIGSVSTDPNGDCGVITDSAASATAYSSGIKTNNGHLGVDHNLLPQKTSLQLAKELGKSTGVVATSQVVHATPAAFYSHLASRDQMHEIANQLLDNRIYGFPYVDVVLGGGLNYFQNNDRNLIVEFENLGYQRLFDKYDLKNAGGERLLGLFAGEGLPCVLERASSDPSLADLTETALQTLSQNDQGFFLLVEGSQIDWASHNNDIHSVMHEMECFEDAFSKVMAFVKSRNDTLVLLTADHETGGLTIGSRIDGINKGAWNPEVLIKLSVSPYVLAENLISKPIVERFAYFSRMTQITLEASERAALFSLMDFDTAICWLLDLLNAKSHTGWTTGGHTGVDVHLYGAGCGVEAFLGYHENQELGMKIQSLINDSSPRLKVV